MKAKQTKTMRWTIAAIGGVVIAITLLIGPGDNGEVEDKPVLFYDTPVGYTGHTDGSNLITIQEITMNV